MLDWIFGSSKPDKKQEPQNAQEKLSPEDAWIYDFVRQYLLSPIWKNPLLDFIEDNCAVFQDSEQNKFQYTKIFQQFTSLCSILIESIVEEIGITFQTLEKCIIQGLKTKSDAKIFTQILVCDNFQTFKRVMISKNRQLEAQVLKKLRDSSKQQDKVQDQIDEKQRQRLQLQQAIAQSLALQEKAKLQEEQQFQQAIRQSQISAKQQAPKSEKPEKVRKSLLGDLPPLMVARNHGSTPAEYKQQKTRLEKEISDLKVNHKEVQDSQERKKRLLQQRELLRIRKREERQQQLKTFVQNKQATSANDHEVTQEELLKRKKLMNRLKDQLRND